MPRPGPKRRALAVRLDADTHDWMDRTAAAWGLTRSDLLRLILDRAVGAPEWRTKGTRS